MGWKKTNKQKAIFFSRSVFEWPKFGINSEDGSIILYLVYQYNIIIPCTLGHVRAFFFRVWLRLTD